MADEARWKALVRELPPEARPLFARLRGVETLTPPRRLADQVKGYRNLVVATAQDDPWINVDRVQALVRSLIELLKGLKRGGPDFDHRAVQAACRYFVVEEDGDDDMESEDGFDDDVEVMNAVATALDREDLVIDLW